MKANSFKNFLVKENNRENGKIWSRNYFSLGLWTNGVFVIKSINFLLFNVFYSRRIDKCVTFLMKKVGVVFHYNCFFLFQKPFLSCSSLLVLWWRRTDLNSHGKHHAPLVSNGEPNRGLILVKLEKLNGCFQSSEKKWGCS